MIFHLTIGSGKTTILRIITGKIQPTTGRVDIGETVQFGYNSQQRDTALNDEKMVWREIVGDRSDVVINQITRESMSARAYVAQFNFRGVDQQKLIGSLSGGERNRVHLAKSLVDGCNVLLLDEPTNDLDVDTLRALEEALQDYTGSAIIVSHDRFFLDRVCTNILSFEYDENGNKHCFYYDGNYTQYEHYKRAVLGKDVNAEQHRFKNINLNA
jgi:energy-dependent translational throttle protein EttA